MRRVRYQVAASLDGFIAGPNGEFDWIVMDPEIDFAALVADFDTLLMGRHTFELVEKSDRGLMGMKAIVFSRTLRARDHAHVTVVGEDGADLVRELRAKPGKDIWLFGGGLLFSSLAQANLVDTVEVAIMPVLLGRGIPLAPQFAEAKKLKLAGHKIYKAGIVSLQYAIL
jgi:dihydrofolate reductase